MAILNDPDWRKRPRGPRAAHVVEAMRARATRHGMAGSPTYKSWDAMRYRCHNQGSKDYPNYGARGIAVCDHWRESFDDFLADMGPKPEGCTLGAPQQ